jgi:hypothetical protein
MPAVIESPWKRVLTWLVVVTVLGGAGAGAYWGLVHPLLHKPAPENKTDEGGKTEPVAVITPGKDGKDKDKGGPRDPSRPPPADVSKADQEDAALLPPDALAFAALRVTDLWNSEAGKQLQLQMEVSGEQYLPQAEKWLGVPFADIDRLIVFMRPAHSRILRQAGAKLRTRRHGQAVRPAHHHPHPATLRPCRGAAARRPRRDRADLQRQGAGQHGAGQGRPPLR